MAKRKLTTIARPVVAIKETSRSQTMWEYPSIRSFAETELGSVSGGLRSTIVKRCEAGGGSVGGFYVEYL